MIALLILIAGLIAGLVVGWTWLWALSASLLALGFILWFLVVAVASSIINKFDQELNGPRTPTRVVGRRRY